MQACMPGSRKAALASIFAVQSAFLSLRYWAKIPAEGAALLMFISTKIPYRKQVAAGDALVFPIRLVFHGRMDGPAVMAGLGGSGGVNEAVLSRGCCTVQASNVLSEDMLTATAVSTSMEFGISCTEQAGRSCQTGSRESSLWSAFDRF